MSKKFYAEVAKFSHLVWYHIPAKQPKIAEQRRRDHWVGKSERLVEQLTAVRGFNYSARAIQRKPRDEQWNVEGVKVVLMSFWKMRVHTKHDTAITRQKYISNQKLDQYGRKPICTRCLLGARAHVSDCRARFNVIPIKELEAQVSIRTEVETANRDADAVSHDSVKVSEAIEACSCSR